MLSLDFMGLYGFGADKRSSAGVSKSGVRDWSACKHELPKLDASNARFILHERHRRVRVEIHEHSSAEDESHTLPGMDRLGDSAKGRIEPRHSARRDLLLLAAGMDSKPSGI